MSQNFDLHPVAKASRKLRVSYYCTLNYFVDQCSGTDAYIAARVEQYRDLLIGKGCGFNQPDDISGTIRSIVNNLFKPWRKKYRYFLLCDLAFILVNKPMVQDVLNVLKGYLRKKQCALMDEFLDALFDDGNSTARETCANILLNQVRKNLFFLKLPKKRIIVTANMGAGKSTLINAIIGKRVTRTAQEACTDSLYYLSNKPIEDNAIHLLASPINLNATSEELFKKSKSEKIYIASYFRTTVKDTYRICMIDTPGVNSALHINHGKLTRNALSNEEYDILIYVFNANKLGTDEDINYLKYISENVPKEKIVFVINKLDDYKTIDDSIESSIDGIRNDLIQLGYENPIICPISAYFAFLVKIKKYGESLTEDEYDIFELFSKKFSKPEYDLSRYYDSSAMNIFSKEDKPALLSNQCGLHGLETILFGS
jgi:signal recognition particle receptor subunit beta